MDKDEALKLALKSLQKADKINGHPNNQKIIVAIKEALAEPEQESDDLTIAYMAGFYDGKNKDAPQPKPEQEPVCVAFIRTYVGKDKDGIEICKEEPLYTTSPQRTWVGLTDDQARKVIEETLGLPEGYIPLDNALNICRAIEAKLRELNT